MPLVGPVSGSHTTLSDGTSNLIAGSNTTIATGSNGAITITAATAQWTDAGSILYPSDGVSENVGLGATSDTATDYDIYLSSDGAAVFNEQGASVDFRVESSNEDQAIWLNGSNNKLHFNKGKSAFTTTIWNNSDNALEVSSSGVTINEEGHSANDFRVETDTKTHALFVDAGTDQVLILSGGGASSINEAAGSDVAFYVSGTAGSKDTATRGTSVFGGDMVLSGALHIVSSSGHGDSGPANMFVLDDERGAAQIGRAHIGYVGSSDYAAFAHQDQATTVSYALNQRSTGQTDLNCKAGTIMTFRYASAVRMQMNTSGDFSVGPNYAPGTHKLAISGSALIENDLFVSGGMTVGFGPAGAGVNGSEEDFIVNTKNITAAFKVDGANDRVIIGSTDAGQDISIGDDTFFYASGSVYDEDWGDKSGVAVFGGDTLFSASVVIYDPIQQDHLFYFGGIPEQVGGDGEDTSFFVSGSSLNFLQSAPYTQIGGKNVAGTTVFQGDTVFSGVMYGGLSGQFQKTALGVAAELIRFNNSPDGFGQMDTGDDVYFQVSGSVTGDGGGKDGSGVAVFGGDLVVSGILYGGYDDEVGSLLLESNADLMILSSQDGSEQVEPGEDTFFYISGSNSDDGAGKDGSSRGVSVFGGDLVVSGGLYGGYGDDSGINTLDVYADWIAFGTSFNDFGEGSGEGEDVSFYVSGSAGAKDSSTRGTALFEGDLVVSGTFYMGDKTAVTHDADGALTQNTRSGHITLTTNGSLAGNNYGSEFTINSNKVLESDIIMCTSDEQGLYPMASDIADGSFKVKLFNWTGVTLADDSTIILNWVAL